MPDYQFTSFPIPGKKVDFEAIQEAITALQTEASALQEQLDALTTRTINGLDLTENRVLKSAQFAESVTGEKMLANLLYSQVNSWDSGAKKSIKLAGNTYLSYTGVTVDGSGRLLSTYLNTATNGEKVRFMTYNNAQSLSVPLAVAQDNHHYSQIIVINANQNVFSSAVGDASSTNNYGARAISVSYSGTTATITRQDGGTFWGSTLVIIIADYALY